MVTHLVQAMDNMKAYGLSIRPSWWRRGVHPAVNASAPKLLPT